MTTKAICPECGAELAPRQLSGLCPRCMMKKGLQSFGNSTLPVEADDASELEPPTNPAHRYTTISEHARGGMGRVLIVHDEALGRDIAMKELLPDGETDEGSTPAPARHSRELVARFLREAKITGQLEHPGIVPVHELGWRQDGSLYYTMKLVHGRTLGDAIREARTYVERLQLLPHFVDLCHAISYAHSRGVVHRDIKPSNVMIGDYGETIVLDWGLAKVQGAEDEALVSAQQASAEGPDEGATETRHGTIMGTPAYMSPEQARGDWDQVDERSDVFSLGSVLYQILTGRTPHEGGSAEEIVKRAAQSSPRPVRDLEPRVSEALARICERAMAKDRRERLKSAAMFAREVEEATRTPDVFLNPFRPYLSDLVPELLLIPHNVRQYVVSEARRRWRRKNLWRSLVQDALIVAGLVLYFGFPLLLAMLDIKPLPLGTDGPEFVDPLLGIEAFGGYWALIPGLLLCVAAGVVTHRMHNRAMKPYVQEVLVELEVQRRLADLPAPDVGEMRKGFLRYSASGLAGAAIGYALHGFPPWNLPLAMLMFSGALGALLIAKISFDWMDRRRGSVLLRNSAA